MSWKFESNKSIYIQVMDKITLDIIGKKYNPGEKIPSVRELAIQASINPNTVQRALSELERGGLIYTNKTSGRFVTKDVDLIDTIRENILRSKVEEFYDQIKKLGVNKEYIFKIINEYSREI